MSFKQPTSPPSTPPTTPRTVRFHRTLSYSPKPLDRIEEHPASSDWDPGDESSDSKWAKSGIRGLIRVAGRTPSQRSPNSLTHATRIIEADDTRYHGLENRFEISVISSRTSCCGTLVRVEHITDWWHGSSNSDGHCPSCKAPCSLRSSEHQIAPPTSTQWQQSSPRSDRALPLLRRLYKSPSFPALLPASALLSAHTRRSSFDSSYTLFNTDDEAYPNTEHTLGLSSSLISTDIYEVVIRVTSIAGLTLFLYALLTRS
ncbi:hypothetical protein Hypma_016538 [Hypsizygus marmoreus]|uniref:Uncharacterized protein n=1 Tax=Hypsizygus marmoreus TaxID=39966 RepID=A0A369IYS6_HYPMA|nr:hypothetical protein Hypma_016538 [Hypsizygus marmoreus]